MTTHSEARATIWLSEELKTRIETHELGYGDSMSEWMRQAALDRLAVEAELAARSVGLPDDAEEREQRLRELLAAGAEAER